MQKSFAHVILLFTRLAILLLVYTVCRLLFFAFNHTYFSDTGIGDLLLFHLAGLRFDLPAIIVINAVYIIAQLLPLKIRYKEAYQKSLAILFYVTNSIGILANCIDLAYFHFTFKRTTADALAFFVMGEDLGNLMPVFLKDYWYVFLIWIGLTALVIWLYRRTKKLRCEDSPGWHLKQSAVFAVALALLLLGYRGGFQLKPVSIISAGEYTDAKHIPLIVNTPFTIIKTLEQPGIEPKTWFNEDEVKKLYSPYHEAGNKGFRNMNVVVIILESFSKEYTSLGSKESCTPFLDSLMHESLLFTNAYANGKRSIEALPAIVASIPTLMNEPYITSVYGSNRIQSLPLLLKQKGYNTSFYHGGTNGTMGFDAFATLAGFDRYYGRTEYNNEKDYDGNWGIWDEEFFQYFASSLDKTKQPFCTAFFSLSSHHPFAVPARYKDRFKEGPLEIMKCVRYSDYSLKRFFETASKMDWFRNTLFVITADHTGLPGEAFYNTSVGNYAIPILFYKGDGSLKGEDNRTMQQIDIMPTVLGYLGYDKKYFAFGIDASDSTAEHYAFNYFSDTYQVTDSAYVLQFDGSRTTALYNYTADSLLAHNIAGQQAARVKDLQTKLQAFIQVYHHCLVNNSMTTQ